MNEKCPEDETMVISSAEYTLHFLCLFLFLFQFPAVSTLCLEGAVALNLGI